MGCHDAKLLEFGIAARSPQPSPGPRSSGWFSGWMTEVAALVTDVAGLRQRKLGGSREGTLPQQTFSSFPSHASFFLLCHFLVELFDFLVDFCCVFCVRIQIEVALVGLDGLLFQPLFLLCFAEVAERNRVARRSTGEKGAEKAGRQVLPALPRFVSA